MTKCFPYKGTHHFVTNDNFDDFFYDHMPTVYSMSFRLLMSWGYSKDIALVHYINNLYIIGLWNKMCHHCRGRICHAYTNIYVMYVTWHNLHSTRNEFGKAAWGRKRGGNVICHIFFKNGRI